MPNLHINIANKVATYTLRDGAVVCDNTDYTAVFTFDAEWATETKKVARFVWKGRHHDVDIQADGTCALPRIQGAKVIHVGVYAGELRTTTSAEIPCEGSILSKTTDPQEGYAAGYVEEIRAAVRHTDEVAKATEELLGDASSTVTRLEKEVQNLRHAIAPEFFQTDAAVAYTKTVPANALPFAEVTEVGGMSYAEGGAIKNAAVTALEIEGANLIDLRQYSGDTIFRLDIGKHLPAGVTYQISAVGTTEHPTDTKMLVAYSDSTQDKTKSINYFTAGQRTYLTFIPEFDFNQILFYAAASYANSVGIQFTITDAMLTKGENAIPFAPYVKRSYPIPAEVQALDGWGMGVNAACHNRLDWEKKQYRQEVRRIRLDGSEEWRKSTATNIFQASTPLSMLSGETKKAPAIVSNGYGFLDWYNPDASVKPYFRIPPNGNVLWIEATVEQFASVDSWKAYLAANPVEIVYPLASPIVTDLPDLPDDNFIEVEGGGTITAANQYGLAVPTAITYQLKEA